MMLPVPPIMAPLTGPRTYAAITVPIESSQRGSSYFTAVCLPTKLMTIQKKTMSIVPRGEFLNFLLSFFPIQIIF